MLQSPVTTSDDGGNAKIELPNCYLCSASSNTVIDDTSSTPQRCIQPDIDRGITMCICMCVCVCVCVCACVCVCMCVLCAFLLFTDCQSVVVTLAMNNIGMLLEDQV